MVASPFAVIMDVKTSRALLSIRLSFHVVLSRIASIHTLQPPTYSTRYATARRHVDPEIYSDDESDEPSRKRARKNQGEDRETHFCDDVNMASIPATNSFLPPRDGWRTFKQVIPSLVRESKAMLPTATI